MKPEDILELNDSEENLYFIIMKNSRLCCNPTIDYAYFGSSTQKVGVLPGRVYTNYKTAQIDADKLSEVNPVGFTVLLIKEKLALLTYDKEKWNKEVKKYQELFLSVIQVTDNFIRTRVRWGGEIHEITERPNKPILIFRYYDENPGDPIDDTDTGGGLYALSNSNIYKEICDWYNEVYKAGKYIKPIMPIYPKTILSNGEKTNNPEFVIKIHSIIKE